MRMRKGLGPNSSLSEAGLLILHEDKDILVVNKPAGLLTIATAKEKAQTAYFILTNHVRAGRAASRIFIVHRLDRETSGVLIFAKTPAAKYRLQDGWSETEKHYLAAVHGRLTKKSDTITSYLAENTVHRVYSTRDTKKGKLCRTAYRVLKEAKGMTLLDVQPYTGRKHQIRVHLADIGHPVVGDRKYGKGDTRTRLALHARSISFPHPTSGKRLTLEASVPPFFIKLFGRIDL